MNIILTGYNPIAPAFPLVETEDEQKAKTDP